MSTRDASLEPATRSRAPSGVPPAVRLASRDRAARNRTARRTDDAVRRWLKHLRTRAL